MCFYGPYYVWLNVGNAWLSHPVDGTRLAALPECFACPTHAAREWGEGTFAYRVMRGGRKDYDVVALPEEGDIHLAVWRATRTGPKVCSPFLNFTLIKQNAIAWLYRARRGQGPIPADLHAYIVRTELCRYSPERVIDMSTIPAQQLFMRGVDVEGEVKGHMRVERDPPRPSPRDGVRCSSWAGGGSRRSG